MIVAVSVASPLRHCLTFGSVPDIRSIKENRPNVVQNSSQVLIMMASFSSTTFRKCTARVQTIFEVWRISGNSQFCNIL